MPDAVRFGRIEIRPDQRQVLVDGCPVAVAARSYDVLWMLIQHRDRVITKAEMLDLVWPGVIVEEHNLHTQVSLLRKVVGAQAIATVPGRGYRFVAVLDSAAPQAAGSTGSTEAAFGAPDKGRNIPSPGEAMRPERNRQHTKAVATPPTTRWSPRTRFVGRKVELETCTQLLADVRLLTLTGIGGSGKTRLALCLLERVSEAFVDGSWFIDLSPLQHADRVASVVCAAMELSEAPDKPPSKVLTASLVNCRGLLVLDNCEHLVGPVRDFVDTLLSACPSMKVFATSRQALGLEGEQVVRVGALSLPSGTLLSDVQASEAVQLFVDRARLSFPGFALHARNARSVGDVCRRLDGLPLAIELAAARVGMLSVEDIAARLDDRFLLLTSTGHDRRHQDTLRSVLEWSHATLSASEQMLFRRLSVFAAGFTIESTARVANLPDQYVTLDLLTQLHDKSLIEVDHDSGGPSRYRMLETVQLFSADLLACAGELAMCRDRHLTFLVEVVQKSAQQIDGPMQGSQLTQLRLIQEDLLSAFEWSLFDSRAPEAALRLAAATWRYWMLSGQTDAGYHLASRAVLHVSGGGVAELIHCRALRAAGHLANSTGRYREAMEFAELGVQLARSLGDPEEMAASLARRGGAHHALGHLSKARQQFDVACEASRRLPSRSVLGASLNGLAEVHRAMGDLSLARTCYEESLTIARDLRNPVAMIVPLCNLARILIGAGDFKGARQLLVEGFDVRLTGGVDGVDDQLLEVAAALVLSTGDPAHGLQLYEASVQLVEEAGSKRERVDEAFITPLVTAARSMRQESTLAEAPLDLSRDDLVEHTRSWLREMR